MLYFDKQREKFGFIDVFAAKYRFQEDVRAMFIGTPSDAFVMCVTALTQCCLVGLNSQLTGESESLCYLFKTIVLYFEIYTFKVQCVKFVLNYGFM